MVSSVIEFSKCDGLHRNLNAEGEFHSCLLPSRWEWSRLGQSAAKLSTIGGTITGEVPWSLIRKFFEGRSKIVSSQPWSWDFYGQYLATFYQTVSTTVSNYCIEDYNPDQTQYKPRNNETDTNTLNGNTLNWMNVKKNRLSQAALEIRTNRNKFGIFENCRCGFSRTWYGQ